MHTNGCLWALGFNPIMEPQFRKAGRSRDKTFLVCPAQIPEHRARGDDNKMAAV